MNNVFETRVTSNETRNTNNDIQNTRSGIFPFTKPGCYGFSPLLSCKINLVTLIINWIICLQSLENEYCVAPFLFFWSSVLHAVRFTLLLPLSVTDANMHQWPRVPYEYKSTWPAAPVLIPYRDCLAAPHALFLLVFPMGPGGTSLEAECSSLLGAYRLAWE